MFSIGEFARHGRISVRMLRHYDAIGLLQPAFVDPSSGYRFYEAAQFADLNRIVAPVIGPLFYELFCVLASAGVVDLAGPPLAYYEDSRSEPGAIVVHADQPVATWPGEDDAVSVVELPAVAGAAAMIHRGSMDDVLPTAQALARWIDRNGYTSVGYAREITLEWSPDRDKWVTELQQPVSPAGYPPI